MSRRSYTLACLAGNGVGPELMAEASRALAVAARPHGVLLDEVHVPFGSEAFMRMGHPLPPATRLAYREADAVLAAGGDPALEGVEADLDLRAALARVVVPGRADLCLVSPLGADFDAWAVERAFELARTRHGCVTWVDVDRRWRKLVTHAADASPGLRVEELGRAATLPLVATEPERFDVLVCDRPLADALVHVTAFGAVGKVVAFGRLSPRGPGLFFPDGSADGDAAGQGTADAAPMLLAAALALGEGLGERAAARTLEGALAAARLRRAWNAGPAATTRELTDVLLAALPSSVSSAEFAREAAA